MSEEVRGVHFPFYCVTGRELQIGFCHSPAEFTRFKPSLCWDASFQTHPPTWVTSGKQAQSKRTAAWTCIAFDLSHQWFVFSFKSSCVFVRPCDTSPFHATHHSMPLKIRCSVTTHTHTQSKGLGNMLSLVVTTAFLLDPTLSLLHQNALIKRHLTNMTFSHTCCLEDHVFFVPRGAVFWQLLHRMFAQTSLPLPAGF